MNISWWNSANTKAKLPVGGIQDECIFCKVLNIKGVLYKRMPNIKMWWVVFDNYDWIAPF